MCGICGVMNFDGAPVGEEVLGAMVGRLSHRGPDAWAIARPAPWMGLGHTRLKVIDLSDDANQPMASQDAAVWIVFNGEVYNYQELRHELESCGRQFRTRSDTEVALQAYQQWGEECVSRFDGMFALAIFDRRRMRVLLARDRAGKKPLCYWTDGRRFIFASEIKALLAHPDVPRAVEPRALPLYLTYGYVPPPDTFYANIRTLRPATRLSVQWPTGRSAEQQYWELRFPTRARRVSRVEAVEGLRERLTEAVRKRLAAEVPLGAFLSGGIDSSIIVGLMSRLMRRPVHTFSIGFRGPARYDETPYARMIATQARSRHTEFVVEPNAFELVERLVYHHDQPFGDASAIPTFLLCQLAKTHVTVALNGDGGDESFGGYVRFQAAVASSYLPRWFSRAAAAGLGQLPPGLQRLRVLGEARRFFEAAKQPWDERLVRWISYFPSPARWLRPELSDGCPADAWLMPARRHLECVRHLSPLAQALYFNFQEYLPNDLNVKMDRCSMAHGLETRSPFLDTDVIEYAAQLPERMKLRGLQRKVILKEAFQDLLPPVIRHRRKQGFGVPLDDWFRAELREPVHDLLLAPGARLRAYIAPAMLRAYWETHLRGERNCGLALWSLLTLEVWLRMVERDVWSHAPAATGEPSPSRCAG